VEKAAIYEQSKSPDSSRLAGGRQRVGEGDEPWRIGNRARPRLQGRNRLADVAARSGHVVDLYIGGRCVPMLSGTIDLT
jgi:hypothetical protein